MAFEIRFTNTCTRRSPFASTRAPRARSPSTMSMRRLAASPEQARIAFCSETSGSIVSVPRRAAALQYVEVERAVEKPRESHALVVDDAQEVLGAIRLEILLLEEDLGERADRRHRRSHFVAHLRQEIVLLRIEPRQPLVRLGELLRSRLQLARFLLEAPAVVAHLLRLVGDAH